MDSEEFQDAGDELALIRQQAIDETRLVEDWKPLSTGPDKETNLSRPLDNCDQNCLDFWQSIAEYHGQSSPSTDLDDQQFLLQNYAKLRVEVCLQRHVGSIARKIGSQLGKMRVPVFKWFERVAICALWPLDELLPDEPETGTGRKSLGSIKIHDGKAAQEAATSLDRNELEAIVEAMKKIKLTNVIDRLQFAQGINRLYKEYAEFVAENNTGCSDCDDDDCRGARTKDTTVKEGREFYEDFIEQPCREVMAKVLSALSSGNIFNNYTGQTLGVALTAKVYRICKKSGGNSRKILNLLLDLNRI